MKIISDSRATRNFGLFISSFLMLFLEIVFIRYLGTEVRIFAYFNNLVLLACFLGFGFGCSWANRPIKWKLGLLAVSTSIFLTTLPLYINSLSPNFHLIKNSPDLLSAFSNSVVWYQIDSSQLLFKVTLGLSVTAILIVLIFLTFLPLGQVLGVYMDSHDNVLEAYSVNVLGSLSGLLFFNLMAVFYQPPWIWFFCVFVLFVFVYRAWDEKEDGLVVYLIFALSIFSILYFSPSGQKPIWSPYQKLEVIPTEVKDHRQEYAVQVNNVGYMGLLNLADESLVSISTNPAQLRKRIQYNIPYEFKKNPDDVLIVGAGGGNDAAGALRNGAKSITAVEIDPGIYRIGKNYHPENPYKDPRVNMVINDARSFLKTSDKKFDLISFGLLDAHTIGSSYNNMRIDHYVYTKESFQEARKLLKSDGVLAVVFAAQREWIASRIKYLLREAFGRDPLSFYLPYLGKFGYGGIMYVISEKPGYIEDVLKNNKDLNEYIKANPLDLNVPVSITTDDWPYLYLYKRQIPTLIMVVSALILFLFLALNWHQGTRVKNIDFHFFFLGSAFLLLEFQNISKTSLLFGATWIVNMLTFSSILVLVLVANFVASKIKKLNIKVVYSLLFFTVILNVLIPVHFFNSLHFIPRLFAANFFLNFPIFFAGLIFINSLRNAADVSHALSSNFLGAGLGGLMESVSFIVGIKALVVLVLFFYVSSFFFYRGKKQAS